MMKKAFFSIGLLLIIGALTACGSMDQSQDNQTTENTKNNKETAHTDNEQQDMKSSMDKLGFYEIEVEISYGKNNEYEAEIEQDKGQPIEAKVEDEVNNEFLTGKDAFDSIYSKAKKLDLSKDSSDQETIDQILQAFDLSADYEKFEAEITFNDDSKLDVENHKTK